MKNRIDRVGIARLEFGHKLRDQMYNAAMACLLLSINFGPVHRGFYIANLNAKRGRGSRAYATYGSRDFKALWIEHGNYTIPRHAPLRKAADALGLRLKGEGRAYDRR